MQDVKRTLFPVAPGKLPESSDHRLGNISKTTCCQEMGFVQISAQLYHRMDQTHYMRSPIYIEALVCLDPLDGDFSPSPTARLVHSLHLEDILPTVT